MVPNSAPPSASMPNYRVRVRVFQLKLSQVHRFDFFPFAIFFIFLTLIIPTTTSIPNQFRQIPYAKFCNEVIPESTPTTKGTIDFPYFLFQNAYIADVDAILGQKSPQSGGHSLKSVSLRTYSVHETQTNGVLRVEGLMSFPGSRFMGLWGNMTRRRLRLINYRPPRIPTRRLGIGFRLYGFYSQASGKLCMVGSGTKYLHAVNVVLKLNCPNVSTLDTSLVTGTLRSLETNDSLNHFEPISILGLSLMNYEYKLVDKEIENGGFSAYDNMEYSSLGLEHGRTVCSAFSAGRFELEYMDDCESVKCNPLGGGNRNLPSFMSLNEIECKADGKLRAVLDFSNTSHNGRGLAFDPNTSLVAEGAWNGKKKHLDLVACRIFNVMGPVANASLGDCSVRLSLRLPSTLSLRNRSPVVGQMWSNKTVNDSSYFSRLAFHSPTNGYRRVVGLKYQYTETDRVRKSCIKKLREKHKGGTYPDGHSSDMRFDMTVKNIKGETAWGYSSPFAVGDRFDEPRGIFPRPNESAVPANNSQSRMLNISYIISFTAPPEFKLDGEVLSSTRHVEISAEGVYDPKTGVLCMIGCRHLGPLDKRLGKNESVDCEILISIQYPLLKADGSNVKGTIESNRNKSDSLYFDRLDLTGNSIFTSQAKKSIWRMDLEITMVLISNTLACIFVGLQLFYVKKYPDVLPFISVVMLIVLTLAQMIPLVLNFDALFLGNRDRNDVFLGSGGWLEVNEVLVRVITMVAFLLQFRLLQQTYSARAGEGSWKRLWASDKKVFFFSLPLYIGGGLIAWFVHQWKYSHKSPLLRLRNYQQPSFWQGFKSYAGLVLDGFLLPQVVFNMFSDSREKALTPSFYVGTTVVRLLPHAYDLFRAHGSTFGAMDNFSAIYANPKMDYYSSVWDIVISCGGLLLVVVIYLQQRFGGRCFLPKRFRDGSVYEKVPVVSGEQ